MKAIVFLFACSVMFGQTSAEVSIESGRLIPITGGVERLNTHHAELYIGTGAFLVKKEKFFLAGKIFIEKHTGLDREEGSFFLRPTLTGKVELSSFWEAEGSVFPYIQLGSSRKRTEWILEGVQTSREVRSWLRIGAGFGAFFKNEEWHHRPFVSAHWTPTREQFGRVELRVAVLDKAPAVRLFFIKEWKKE